VNTGAEAVENAVKIARAASPDAPADRLQRRLPRPHHVRHGLTGKVAPYKIKFGPFPGEIFHVPFPNALHGVSWKTIRSRRSSCCSLRDIEASRVAAIFIEPVQGEGGYVPAPLGFLRRLRALCDTHGILLVADEVQTGIARCGKLFASEHYGVEPDIITLAKGLGGGLPVAAVVGKARSWTRLDVGGLGSTYAGNPVAVRRRAGGARRDRGREALRSLDGARRAHARALARRWISSTSASPRCADSAR
jgi:4-aminobutyrate aminotransferase-like enzyme